MSYQTDFERYSDEDWTDYSNTTQAVSKETYEQKQPSILSDRVRVYNAIAINGGITCKELSISWGCTPNEISGRFTELHKDGLIVAYDKKYLPNSKGCMYPHTIWRATR